MYLKILCNREDNKYKKDYWGSNIIFRGRWRVGENITFFLLGWRIWFSDQNIDSRVAKEKISQLCCFSYPTTSRAWRLKGVLLFSLWASLVLCFSLILRQVVTLCLHWNPEVDYFLSNPSAGCFLPFTCVACSLYR
jgi:hypothetical protein